MTGPTQTIYVETQALYNCASAWRDDAAPKLTTAKTMAAHGEGQGYLFGVLLADLRAPHDAFATAATQVLGVGNTTATDMGAAIEEVAKDYESTDANVREHLTKKKP